MERNHYIYVDGRRLAVAKNVHDAFRVFRAYSSTPLRYWIDCICINQTDDEEKSQQVPLMPDIYALSMIVMIWLGYPTAESERATRFVNNLTQHPFMIKAVDMFLDLRPLGVVWASETPILMKLWETAWNEFI